MEDQIVFGDQMIPITLPDGVRSAPAGLSTTLSAVADIRQEIRHALQHPLGRPPLPALVTADSKVTIAFDDPTVPCFAPVWEPAIQLVVAELEKAGVKRSSPLKRPSRERGNTMAGMHPSCLLNIHS